ncbi:hypothetical protein WICPIJ_001702 [Wickerhamomyces pijperi]|uniref:DASH complex subunit DAD1 n=1 Tax=Wickerhamomyces pijperi TaxID=599730 RepID=A0A9P8TQJ2_WICPI|nr:hypothetical protein WICPIJ_001702 [Wickerhamomyces pijperi]
MTGPPEPHTPIVTYFEKQRDLLIAEIARSVETSIAHTNTLNRSLKANIAVGKEFEAVAEQWKGFYDNVSHLAQVRELQGKLRADDQTTLDESQRTDDLKSDPSHPQ